MRIVLFGATGMIGQGVLRACLEDPGVTRVLAVGRNPAGASHPKLRELIEPDLFEVGAHADDLSDYDTCLYCLGSSAAGMDEAGYTRLTHDLTLVVAGLLARLNPGMTFVFVSGAGTDASETGWMMWARIKGRTENALRRLPFKAAYAVRPGFIQPLGGIRSRSRIYRILYPALGPLLTLVRRFLPQVVLTTDNLARAMLAAARGEASKPVLEASDIYRLSLVRDRTTG